MSALDNHLRIHSIYCGVWEADGVPCSCDVEAARAELAALRASLNDAQVQEYMSRCRGGVLAEMNDHLRAENEAMRRALEEIAGEDQACFECSSQLIATAALARKEKT